MSLFWHKASMKAWQYFFTMLWYFLLLSIAVISIMTRHHEAGWKNILLVGRIENQSTGIVMWSSYCSSASDHILAVTIYMNWKFTKAFSIVAAPLSPCPLKKCDSFMSSLSWPSSGVVTLPKPVIGLIRETSLGLLSHFAWAGTGPEEA